MHDIEKAIEGMERFRADFKPFCGNKFDWERFDAGLDLLKKQKEEYPVCEKCGKEIDHIITSIFDHEGYDSDYSLPITYNKQNGCVMFSTSKNWTGYELLDEEQKESIRCPYCGKFPFDSSVKNEFYLPVNVMMWTSEGRES